MALSRICFRNVGKSVYSAVNCNFNRVSLWSDVCSGNLSDSGQLLVVRGCSNTRSTQLSNCSLRS